MPTLNEEVALRKLAEELYECRRKVDFSTECIVADGGSSDKTIRVCQEYGIKVVSTGIGRGRQLSGGAEAASGEIFLFLHADSSINDHHCRKAVELAERHVIAGGFHLRFNSSHPILKIAEKINRIRFSLTNVIYGDHGIFISRKNYYLAGGFSTQPLFEDVEFSKRLRKIGRICLANPPIITSSRRFDAGGVLRTYLKMACLHTLYWYGVAPERLSKWYSTHQNEIEPDSHKWQLKTQTVNS